MAWAEHDPDVALWWQDECWFSRFAQPNAHDWGGIDLLERPVPAKAPDKALAQMEPHPTFGVRCGNRHLAISSSRLDAAALARPSV